MAYQPNNPNGQATAENSAPVVLASDRAVQVQEEIIHLLSEIQSVLLSIASTRGTAADLRATIINSPSVGVPSVQTVGAFGPFGFTQGAYHATTAVPNWQNQTAVQSFTNNIVRS